MPSTKKTILNDLVTIRDFIRFAVSEFTRAEIYFGHGTDNAWDEAVYLILHTLHLAHDIDPAVLDARLTVDEKKDVLKIIALRVKKRIPAPYLTHEAWFAGIPFFVNEHVLIPRSPIAELIEKQFSPWISRENVTKILDIGTGSGCIAIACALAFPDATVDAVDTSAEALKVAQINCEKHGVSDRLRLLKSDVFSALKDNTYDIIVSNPPYVGHTEMKSLPTEYHREPRNALFAGKNGDEIVTKILQDAAKHLSPNGILVVEVGNSMELIAQKYPKLPFTWLDFENGESEVFLLTQKQLQYTTPV